ncbi:hypothetical protein ACLM5J_18905 [Nocardioides sp. Bht2]|uniref:hypothetical protein n=1 Tax=Nocardioides sp. Bht2 TaxID=3392297 RepID=UPI0039B5511F
MRIATTDPDQPSHLSHWGALVAAAAAVLVALGLGGYLLFAPVSTTGLALPGWESQECGRPALVLNDGTAYDSGEYRPNQNAFDDACLRLSRDRVRLAAAAGLSGALGLLPLAVIARDLSRAAPRRLTASQQPR